METVQPRNKDTLAQVSHLVVFLIFAYLVISSPISCPLPVSSPPIWLFSQVLQSRGPVCVDRHSQSLDDVRLFPPPTPLGSTLPPDTSLSYTFGLPDPQANPKSPSSADPHMSYYPAMHCQTKPSFYGRRAPNCLSLDLLGEEQLLEFIL